MLVNENFTLLADNYLFSEVAAKVRKYKETHPDAEIIRMDIGDVTLPLPGVVIEALHRAVDDMAKAETFHGYGPEQGYSFLREAIAEGDYRSRGIDIEADEIFVSDGAKSDLGNLGDIYSADSVVAVADPGYPVYVDTTVLSGRGGALNSQGFRKAIVYAECSEANGFQPQVPEAHADVIILCSPSNPTGAVMTRELLRQWVDYALAHKSLIIFDSAYEAFITDPALPRSIYEIPGADKVAIEVRSFSKTAGFTGLRCGYTVVPHNLIGYDSHGNAIPLHKLWLRRQTTKFNGASYIVQRGAAALYTPEGREAIRRDVDYYRRNAGIIRNALQQSGFEGVGGDNSPYIWARYPGIESSWELFNTILDKTQVSTTPGIGFGVTSDGFIRFTGFNSHEKTLEAMDRINSYFRNYHK